MNKKPGYGLFIVLLAIITAAMIGAGELWPLKSVFADKEQEKAIWEDLNGIASGIRVYVQEKGYPPESLNHLISEDYVAPITEVSKGGEYCWTMHYGKINVFLGEIDEATGAETYIHDSKGKPFLASVEYNSPEPVVFITSGVRDPAAVYNNNNVDVFDMNGRYLYRFKTKRSGFTLTRYYETADVCVGDGSIINLAWSPISDTLFYANSYDDKIYEYSLKGELLDSYNIGFDISGGTLSWVDRTGRFFIKTNEGSVGAPTLLCFSPDKNLLWKKDGVLDQTEGIIDMGVIGTTNFFLQPEIFPSPKYPDGGFLIAGSPSYPYDFSGNIIPGLQISKILTAQPNGEFFSCGHSSIQTFRYDVNGTFVNAPENILELWNSDKTHKLNIYNIYSVMGKTYIIERNQYDAGASKLFDSRLHTFDYNDDFSGIKKNYVIAGDGKLVDAIGLCVRRTSQMYVGYDAANDGIVKVGTSGNIEGNIDLSIIPEFNHVPSRMAINKKDIYVSCTAKPGLYQISTTGDLVAHFGTHCTYIGVAFDGEGRLWAARYGSTWIDVYDIDSQIILFSFDSGIYCADLAKDPYGNMWISTYLSSDDSMYPKVFDSNGNYLYSPDIQTPTNEVSHIAFDKNGNMFLCGRYNSTRAFQKYSASGKLLIDKSGLYGLLTIQIDSLSRLWGVDINGRKIRVFDNNLNLLRTMDLPGPGLSIASAPFDQPTPELFVSHGDGGVTFDQSLAVSGKYGEYGTLPGKFRDPSDIAIAGNKLFQVDKGNKRINVLTYQGSYLSELGTDELNDPSSCTIDPLTGRLFVVDKEGATEYVKVFDADGVYLGVVRNGIVPKSTVVTGDQYTFKDVSGVGYYGASGYSSRLAVADRGNSRVQVMDGVGYIFKSIPCDDPADVTFDESGNIYILDDDAIDVYNTSGVLQSTLDGPGWSITNGSSLSYYKDELFIVDQDGLLRLGKDGVYKGRRSMSGLKYIGVAQNVLPYIYVADGDKDKILAYDAWGNYMTEWGESGSDPEQLDGPSAVGVDGDGNVYVADSSDYIKKYDKDGVFLFRFGGSGVFDGVSDITVHKDSLYITESGTSRVQLFDTNGTFQSIVAESGALPGQVSGSGCIGINPLDDSLWIPDSGNNRLQSYDGGNNFALISGQYGTTEVGVNESPNLNNPTAISVIGDTLYVLDSGNKKIRALDSSTGNFKSNTLENLPAGLSIMKNDISGRIFVPWSGILAVIRGESEEVGSIGDTGSGRGQLSNPNGLAVLPVYKERIPGSIFVLGANQKIYAYDKDMNLLYSFGGKSYGVGELIYPYDIIQNPSGNVHVLDSKRIYTFSYDGKLLNTVPRPSAIYVLYEIAGSVYGGRTSTNLDYSDWIKLNNDGTYTYVSWWNIPYHVDSLGYCYKQIKRCVYTGSTGAAVNRYNPSGGSYVDVFMNYLGDGGANGVFYDNAFKARYLLQLIWKNNKAYAISLGTVGIYDINGKHLNTKSHGMREPAGYMTQWKPTDYGFLGVGDGHWKFKRYDNDFNVIENVNLANLPDLYKASVAFIYNGGWWNSSSNTYFMTDARTKVAAAFKSGASSILKSYGYYNTSFGNFSASYEINADNTGVYVRDYGNGNLKKFDLFGKPLWIYGPAQNESKTFSSGTSTRYFSLDKNYLYVPDFYHHYIHVIDKTTGTKIRTISTPSYSLSAQLTANGKLVSGKYNVTSSTAPLYYIGDKSSTSLVSGPGNAAYYGLYGGGSSESRGINQVYAVKDLIVVSRSNNMWVYNSSNTFLGRKYWTGSYMSLIKYVPETDEVWINRNNSPTILVFDYSTFLSNTDLTGKQKKTITLPFNAYCFAYVE